MDEYSVFSLIWAQEILSYEFYKLNDIQKLIGNFAKSFEIFLVTILESFQFFENWLIKMESPGEGRGIELKNGVSPNSTLNTYIL